MGSFSLFQNVEWLDVANNHGYGLLPLPTQRDEQIATLINEWRILNPIEREAASQSLTEDQASTLVAYSERMASLAVRLRSRDLILFGLLGLGIDGWRGDWRENTLLLCLHFNASKKIGLNPEVMFGEAAKLLSAKVSAALVAFLERSPEDQSLAAMGYKESKDSDGFRYQRTW